MVPMSQYETCQGIVILVHGLESNTEGAFMTKMATAYSERGFASVLVSFRGCSGEENLTPGIYTDTCSLGRYSENDLRVVSRSLSSRIYN